VFCAVCLKYADKVCPIITGDPIALREVIEEYSVLSNNSNFEIPFVPPEVGVNIEEREADNVVESACAIVLTKYDESIAEVHTNKVGPLVAVYGGLEP
jgi:hypothetical protein